MFEHTGPSAAPGAGAWRIAGVAAAFFIFSSPAYFLRARGATPSYVPTTIAFAALVTAIVIIGPKRVTARFRSPSGWFVALVAIVACVLIGAAARHWVGLILLNPIDPNRADMLPVIDAALRRFLSGRDPYAIYRVPWEAPLGYGPVLWLPFLIPHWLRADLRLASVAGELTIVIWCAVVAVWDARRGRFGAAVAWLAVMAAVIANPDLSFFTPVAHTPVYWPLLPLFALLVAAGRWQAAAVVLGLIVVGRSTMAAGVPIFFLWIWHDRRQFATRAAFAFAAPVAALMLPFAVWDPHALWYGMVAVYPRVIKAIVWPVRNQGVDLTVGLTGPLVAHGLGRFVEVSQVAAVLLVYVGAWRAIRRGARPMPWMALAVLAFCMTTLWPLYYIYFDVLFLLAAAAMSDDFAQTQPLRSWVWPTSVVVAAAVTTAAAVLSTDAYPSFDFREPRTQQWLYAGTLQSDLGGERLPWIWGTDATIAVPRRSTAPADILINAEPVVPRTDAVQSVTAFLNGRLLATVQMPRGRQEVRLKAPADAWLFGANELHLSCGTSTPPIQAGLGPDGRHLALGLRGISVLPRESP